MARGFFVFIGILLFIGGVGSTIKGRTVYPNYWGGVVFAPLAAVMGLLIIFVSIFRFKKFTNSRISKKGKVLQIPPTDYKKW